MDNSVATAPPSLDDRIDQRITHIAAEAGITAVHRGMLEEWSAGEPLKVLE
ncbi:hypothetical protein [Streptomyces brasiliensis]|uniref:Uncharacterized protein n=1 Tax=Streptomyces brasiliensis TaxID=1954 RepID=A0A917NPD2_9ACTN|nr:hypothetical protein [Streptomyces brasiliensis]GGJ15545.1 hypothetical protein GCM10010121_027810 [Streptomyces brasiliensis]